MKILLQDRLTLDLSTLKSVEQETGKAKNWIMGLDEVGWGCIAGDLVLGAVLIHKDLLAAWPEDEVLAKIRDSKKLSSALRQAIKSKVESFNWSAQLHTAYGICSVDKINQFGLAWAFDECVRQISQALLKDIDQTVVFLDGKRVPKSLAHFDTRLQIKGDDLSLSIGLASILAKETRDEMMTQLDAVIPGYDLAVNKGYGTSKHTEALKKMGLSLAHRIGASTKIIS